ncbi:carboxypeptidase-like regulatory domain-containing protein [Pajaroellobacter abortibovis]|uniref:carboxypeptidase-like regulatory domain-containing protein n=1 Tax=Pajaroellobacter abortibovis TaxID=1882918 RepID=UPI00156069FC|nr:carboxypeptidase-like regulatory domain-containing protein [Pajaroellobacter abortibovis]
MIAGLFTMGGLFFFFRSFLLPREDSTRVTPQKTEPWSTPPPNPIGERARKAHAQASTFSALHTKESQTPVSSNPTPHFSVKIPKGELGVIPGPVPEIPHDGSPSWPFFIETKKEKGDLFNRLTTPPATTLSNTIPLHIDLKDSRGFPIAHAAIEAISLNSALSTHFATHTNQYGESVLKGAGMIPLRIIFKAPGYVYRTLEPVHPQSEIEVVLQEGTTVCGSVRESRSGIAIHAAEVIIHGIGQLSRTSTDRNGYFTFADQAPGRNRFEVHARGFCLFSQEVMIEKPKKGGQPQWIPPFEVVPSSNSARVFSSSLIK